MSKLVKNFFTRVPLREKINFTQHLAIIVKAAVPIVEGLNLIKKQTKSKAFLAIIDALIVDVNSGKYLADSLENHRHIFGDFYISIIRIGESSGTLFSNLNYLAEEMEKSYELKNKIRSAAIYPIIILCVTFAVVGFLIFFVFPKLIVIFSNLKVQLPLSTRILIGGTHFILKNGLYLTGGIVILIVTYQILYRKVDTLKYLVEKLQLLIPVVSGIIANVNIANFSRVLSVLLKSGIQIVEALTISSRTSNNLAYNRAILGAAEEVKRGGQLASYLGKYKKLFPPVLLGLIEIGENTGNLEENLMYLSEHYTKEIDYKIRNLTSILEPMLLLIMGLLVGFVAISIMQPIYQSISAVR